MYSAHQMDLKMCQINICSIFSLFCTNQQRLNLTPPPKKKKEKEKEPKNKGVFILFCSISLRNALLVYDLEKKCLNFFDEYSTRTNKFTPWCYDTKELCSVEVFYLALTCIIIVHGSSMKMTRWSGAVVSISRIPRACKRHVMHATDLHGNTW